MYQHILVATDFSIPSLAAVWSARELARKMNSRLTLLSVYDDEEQATIAREALEEVRATTLGGLERVELTAVPHARADVAICGHAVAVGADLVVAGRHGQHRLDERLIGSTTERVVRHAPCSVLVVHPAQREALTSLKHIVAGSDFSEFSLPAIDAAAELAKLFEAWLTLIHVYDVLPPVPVLEDPSHTGVEFTAMVSDSLEKLRSSRLEGVPSTVQALRDKSTVTGLCEWADDHEVDLLVLGTHGRTGVTRLLLGSVAERVVRHAPCAVMVVRPRAKS